MDSPQELLYVAWHHNSKKTRLCEGPIQALGHRYSPELNVPSRPTTERLDEIRSDAYRQCLGELQQPGINEVGASGVHVADRRALSHAESR